MNTIDPLESLFEPLKRVKPRAEFVAKSRTLLLVAKREDKSVSFRKVFFADLAFGGALILASVLVVLGIGIYSSLGVRAVTRQGVDAESVLRESQELDFNIQLGEAVYFDESADAVAAILEEITGSHTYREVPREGKETTPAVIP